MKGVLKGKYIWKGEEKCFLNIFQHFSSSLCFYFSSFVLSCNFCFLITHWFLLPLFLLFCNTFMQFFFWRLPPGYSSSLQKNLFPFISIPFICSLFLYMSYIYFSSSSDSLFFRGGCWFVAIFLTIDFIRFGGLFFPCIFMMPLSCCLQNFCWSKCPTYQTVLIFLIQALLTEGFGVP